MDSFMTCPGPKLPIEVELFHAIVHVHEILERFVPANEGPTGQEESDLFSREIEIP